MSSTLPIQQYLRFLKLFGTKQFFFCKSSLFWTWASLKWITFFAYLPTDISIMLRLDIFAVWKSALFSSQSLAQNKSSWGKITRNQLSLAVSIKLLSKISLRIQRWILGLKRFVQLNSEYTTQFNTGLDFSLLVYMGSNSTKKKEREKEKNSEC